jgi:hypothetical protein
MKTKGEGCHNDKAEGCIGWKDSTKKKKETNHEEERRSMHIKEEFLQNKDRKKPKGKTTKNALKTKIDGYIAYNDTSNTK